jgi:hypothetical protein
MKVANNSSQAIGKYSTNLAHFEISNLPHPNSIRRLMIGELLPSRARNANVA